MHSCLKKARLPHTRSSPAYNSQRQGHCLRSRLACPAYSSNGKDNSNEELKAKAEEAFKAASKKASEFAELVGEGASRGFRKLDSEYRILENAERLGKRLEEAAKDVDQTYNVRRRFRNSVEYVQRMWPTWQGQLDAFAQTWYGKATLLFVMFLIFSSPIFWSILNFVLILWWLAIPIGVALINAAQQRAAAQAAAAMEEEERRRANPFADMFRQRATGRAAAGGYGMKRGFTQQDGPVVDAEFTVIKDDNDSKRK